MEIAIKDIDSVLAFHEFVENGGGEKKNSVLVLDDVLTRPGELEFEVATVCRLTNFGFRKPSFKGARQGHSRTHTNS